MKTSLIRIKYTFSFIIAILAWFAVIGQYYLMVENSSYSLLETSIRFFSYFTILTNSIVALYFSNRVYKCLKKKSISTDNFGNLTAITVYILIVGLVYQIILRHSWSPQGLQMFIDEILHTAIPILVLIYWFMNKKSMHLNYSQIAYWLTFPLVYLFYILIQGYYSNFFPYPFLNFTDIGFSNVVVNCLFLTALFSFVSLLFVWTSKLKNGNTNTLNSQ